MIYKSCKKILALFIFFKDIVINTFSMDKIYFFQLNKTAILVKQQIDQHSSPQYLSNLLNI